MACVNRGQDIGLTMLSFSTCWNSHRHTNGRAMLEEIADMGFERVELGHGIRLSLVEGIEKFLETGRLRVSSVHNFCPLPVDVLQASPNCLELSSHRPQERRRAILQTRKTIDFANRVGAPLMVMHLGRVPIGRRTVRLKELLMAGELHSRRYVRAKLDTVRKREKLAGFYVQRVLEGLKEIAEYAGEKGVRIGVENRDRYEELPFESEIPGILDALGAGSAGYWHDFGHAQVKHQLGFIDHTEWLTSIAPRLVGCHLHDTRWPLRDHMAPFAGEVPYDDLIPLLPPGVPLIWEMSPRRGRQPILDALAQWRERFPGTL